MYMVAPTRVIDDGQGRVAGLELIRNELGAPDDKGRRRPEPVAGSEFVIPCDMVLVAIGQRQDNRSSPASRCRRTGAAFRCSTRT